jgi:hypothetical protein
VEIDVVSGRTARKRPERLLGDETLGTGSDERHDIVPLPDEKPAELARLVGSDATGDPEEDARHAEMMPAPGGNA